jgi:hypothetical protein
VRILERVADARERDAGIVGLGVAVDAPGAGLRECVARVLHTTVDCASPRPATGVFVDDLEAEALAVGAEAFVDAGLELWKRAANPSVLLPLRGSRDALTRLGEATRLERDGEPEEGSWRTRVRISRS